MAVGTASQVQPVVALRHRRNARMLTARQLADLRKAITAAQAIKDDRGYQAQAGIHGLPLPISCTHNSPLFLPWHRAYLYFFEKALQDRVPGVTLTWWNWTTHHDEGMPKAFTRAKAPDGSPNALRGSPIQRSARDGGPARTFREAGQPGAPPLPSPGRVENVLRRSDFMDFQSGIEDLHNAIHVWVGGTMGSVPTSAYDPIFWAHHTMIDRLWRMWQLRHPSSGPPASLLNRALPPFGMTVRDTLDSDALGYDYASNTSAAAGTG